MCEHMRTQTASIALFCALAILFTVQLAHTQSGFRLTPVSGSDGVFQVVVIEGDTVYRSVGSSGSYESYMYFQTSADIRSRTVYLEVTYKDIGYGKIGVEYNSITSNFKLCTVGFVNFLQNTNRTRTAVFKLTEADFRNAQHLDCDLRLYREGNIQMNIISAFVYLEPTPTYLLYDEDWITPYSGPRYTGDRLVDATTLTGKVICGYQGWFRAAGDHANVGWVHYARGDFSDLTVDMWPDMLEYSEIEKYPVPGWTLTNGEQAYLFSSSNKKTILRHFQWMEAYGIDCAAIQRFVPTPSQPNPLEPYRIPAYAREAANRTGRTYFIMYDVSGRDPNTMVEVVRNDWQFLVDSMKITQDSRYLRHNGKPVVAIFGFFVDRFSDTLIPNQVLDLFQNGGRYEAYVIGSGEWWWRSETAPGWQAVFRRMDAYIPWNVGHYNGDNAEWGYWLGDKKTLDSAGAMYMPLVFPGFSWDNLQNEPPGTTNFPRRQGKVLWNQFLAAKGIGAQAVYVAMFDEIDEGTAIFKVTNNIPVNHYFITLEGLPSDFYLLLTGFATNIINGTVAVPSAMPDFASQSQPPVPEILTPAYGDTVTSPVSLSWTPAQHLAGISGYEIEIDKQLVTDTSSKRTMSLAEGRHTIRVRARNGLGNNGAFSEAVVFTVAIVAAPASPTLLQPANAATGVPVTSTLSWNASTGATSYRVQVSTAQDFSSTVLDDSLVTGTSRQVGPLSNNTTYYWRVSAKNAGGSSAFSAAWSFTTIVAVPAIPVLDVPADTAINLPLNTTLSWNAATGATAYHLQVSTSSAFTPNIVDDTTITATSKAIGPLTLATTYYWRVRSKNAAGYSAFSAARSFKTIRTTAVERLEGAVPTDYVLSQNYPNPFNPSTTIQYDIPTSGFVSLKVYNVLGEAIVDLVSQHQEPGRYLVRMNAESLPSGMYLYQLRTGSFVQTKRMILTK